MAFEDLYWMQKVSIIPAIVVLDVVTEFVYSTVIVDSLVAVEFVVSAAWYI